MNLDYLVHDFAHICRKLTKSSKIVLFDLGASLSFHGGLRSPVLSLILLYQKFGLPFDHIYAYEAKQIDPEQVYNDIPVDMLQAYHWYNVPIMNDINSKKNPINLMKKFRHDDLVIVKLDIDSAAVEVSLIKQILNSSQNAEIFIDHLYFEHHVEMKELADAWSHTINGSMKDSLELFQTLRKHGIASHYWV
jgi:hypothetical protein